MKAGWAVVGTFILPAVLMMVLRSARGDARLHDPNPAVRAAAVRCLTVGSDADQWVSALKDDDSDVRLLSAMRLGGGWPHATSATGTDRLVPALIDALKDRHAGVRRAAAEALGEWWPASEKALADALTDPDARVRAGAAFALSWAPDCIEMLERKVTTAQAELLRPLLRALLNDEDREVRRNATWALARIR
jgi:HEAT repeat protein